jgi:hypothetical protein
MRTGNCYSLIVGYDESGTKNLGLGFICSSTSGAIYRKSWKNVEREDQRYTHRKKKAKKLTMYTSYELNRETFSREKASRVTNIVM